MLQITWNGVDQWADISRCYIRVGPITKDCFLKLNSFKQELALLIQKLRPTTPACPKSENENHWDRMCDFQPIKQKNNNSHCQN